MIPVRQPQRRDVHERPPTDAAEVDPDLDAVRQGIQRVARLFGRGRGPAQTQIGSRGGRRHDHRATYAARPCANPRLRRPAGHATRREPGRRPRDDDFTLGAKRHKPADHDRHDDDQAHPTGQQVRKRRAIRRARGIGELVGVRPAAGPPSCSEPLRLQRVVLTMSRGHPSYWYVPPA
jgi:hypothetical protein